MKQEVNKNNKSDLYLSKQLRKANVTLVGSKRRYGEDLRYVPLIISRGGYPLEKNQKGGVEILGGMDSFFFCF